jgi:hypothetical protein
MERKQETVLPFPAPDINHHLRLRAIMAQFSALLIRFPSKAVKGMS